jgi:hypothetical protein
MKHLNETTISSDGVFSSCIDPGDGSRDTARRSAGIGHESLLGDSFIGRHQAVNGK